MKISDMPRYTERKSILTLSADSSVFDAVKKMKSREFGAALVTEGDKVLGIFTERDLLNRVVAAERDAKTTKVTDVMTKDIKVAREDDTVVDSLGRMSNGRFRHLPVVDKDDNLTGFVSQGDFVAMTWPLIFDQAKHRAGKQFFKHTQLWMMVIIILAYIFIAPIIYDLYTG